MIGKVERAFSLRQIIFYFSNIEAWVVDKDRFLFDFSSTSFWILFEKVDYQHQFIDFSEDFVNDDFVLTLKNKFKWLFRFLFSEKGFGWKEVIDIFFFIQCALYLLLYESFDQIIFDIVLRRGVNIKIGLLSSSWVDVGCSFADFRDVSHISIGL